MVYNSSMSTPILTTKLYIPAVRSKVVRRPRLIERLNAGLHRKLTIISAPAGFGKTTLVSDWVGSCGRPVAWLSLDEADNDTTRFLTYIIVALQTIKTNIGEVILAALQSPQPPLTESIITALLNEISASTDNFALVLDDYHVIDTNPVNDLLSFILDHLPPQLHLVITTREDPSLPLARLRARGQLTELRAADLRFTAAEAAKFLNEVMNLNLSAEDIDALETRTEGWIAGLQLAAISMQGHKDTSSFISSFTGSHRFVLDYLLEEVLHQQPESVKTFLLRTSILERLCSSLCEAVMHDSSNNGQEMLEHLENLNLFLIPLDDKRQWYRYHHLFADVLQAQSNQSSDLHKRASEWFAQNNMPSDAIRHAFAAEDFGRAASLIERAWPAIHRSFFQSPVFLSWVKSLPDELVRARPVLSTGYAWALLDIGELEAAEEKLRDAEIWLDKQQRQPSEMIVEDEAEFDKLPATIAIARAYFSQAFGNVPETMMQASLALSLLPESDHLSRGPASALLGLAYWSIGELDEAHKSLAEGMASLHKAGNIAFAISGTYGLADIRVVQGRLRDAVHTYEQSLKLAKQHGEPVLQGTSDLYLGLSELYRELGDLQAANQYLEQSEQLGEQAGLSNWPYRFRLGQARLKQTQGELDSALNILHEAEQYYFRGPLPDVQSIAALKARLWIRQGKLEKAFAWIRDGNLSAEDDLNFVNEFDHITLARVLIAQYKKDQDDDVIQEAMKFLQRILKATQDGGRTGSVIEIFILQALANQAQGNISDALDSLQQALTLAEPEGYVRIFVDEGNAMSHLLSTAETHGMMPSYVRMLLIAFEFDEHKKITYSTAEPSLTKSLIEPLSKRELKVLQLIAQGLSNREIGEKLFLALDTVKGHNRRIFSKLQVKSRTEAIAKARSLNILSSLSI